MGGHLSCNDHDIAQSVVADLDAKEQIHEMNSDAHASPSHVCDIGEKHQTLDKKEKKILDENHYSAVIQKNWRNRQYIKNVKVVNEKVNPDGKFISIDAMHVRTSPEIANVEKKLTTYFGNEEDRALISELKVLRPPFQYNIDKSIYYGYWDREGLREGYGVYIDSYNKKFEGLWRKGEFFVGRIFDTDGGYYEGKAQNNLPEGEGSYKSSKSDLFVGTWKAGHQVLQGERWYADKTYYKGNFAYNLYNGKGLLIWNDGGKYEGDFEMGMLGGNGIFTSAKGSSYEGAFTNNLPHGIGKFQSFLGPTYQGQYMNGVKEGKGKLSLLNGTYYEGKWMNNVPHGFGEYCTGKKLVKGYWRYGRYVCDCQSNIPTETYPNLEFVEDFKKETELSTYDISLSHSIHVEENKLKNSRIYKPYTEEIFGINSLKESYVIV